MSGKQEWKKSGVAVRVSNGNSLTNLENLILQATKALEEHMANKGLYGPSGDETKIEFETKEDAVKIKISCRYHVDGRWAVYEKVTKGEQLW